MSNNALPGTSSTSAGHGLAGLVALAVTLTGVAGTLGARAWQVGSDLGAALFPVEDIVELAAVAAGTTVAGWVGLHAFLALACFYLWLRLLQSRVESRGFRVFGGRCGRR
jgi:hypothetical protein